MNMDTEIFKAIASNNIFQIVFSVGAVLSGIKIMLVFHGWRIFSFIRVYKHRKEFYDHKIFYKIESILSGKYIENSIQDIAKKEIAKDIIEIEMKLMRRILRFNLHHIFKKNLWLYLKTFPEFKNEKIVKLFREEFTKSRTEFERRARDTLTRNGYMSQTDFNRFLKVYSEFFVVYEIQTIESIEIFSERKNIYGTLWDMLAAFDAVLETMHKTIAHKFNLMNGRIDWIEYKGHVVGEDKKREIIEEH